MRRILTISFILCGLAGLPAKAVSELFELTPEQILMIEDHIAAQLVDPWSAEFRTPSATQDGPDRGYACGLVNSKNRMGGYAGWTPYFVMISSIESFKLHTPMIGGQYSPRSVASTCRSHGVALGRQ